MALKYDRRKIGIMSLHTIRRTFTEKEIRAAYKKFRKEFRERVREMDSSEYAKTDRWEDAKEVFLPAQTKAPIEAVTASLYEITRWLNNDYNTVEGMRKADAKRLETFRLKGYTSIKSKEDLIKFGKFMRSIRPYFDAQNPYSERATAELFEFAISNNISIPNIMSNYSFYLKNLDRVMESDLTIKSGRKRGMRKSKAWTAKQLAKELKLRYEERDTIY